MLGASSAYVSTLCVALVFVFFFFSLLSLTGDLDLEVWVETMLGQELGGHLGCMYTCKYVLTSGADTRQDTPRCQNQPTQTHCAEFRSGYTCMVCGCGCIVLVQTETR